MTAKTDLWWEGMAAGACSGIMVGRHVCRSMLQEHAVMTYHMSWTRKQNVWAQLEVATNSGLY